MWPLIVVVPGEDGVLIGQLAANGCDGIEQLKVDFRVRVGDEAWLGTALPDASSGLMVHQDAVMRFDVLGYLDEAVDLVTSALAKGGFEVKGALLG